ncbi:GH3 auxin-responsive promoter family protein [Senegalimassilia anaerobia]
MAHDEKISELTGNDAHHEQPASASAPAQMPDVATLRAMMHERRYAAGKALEQQLEADVLHAREVQEELLFEMIEANKDTPFGRDHGFADIKTVEDFKRTVPFTSYDDYAGYIYEVMERGTRGVVITEEIVHFNETSGAMGNPKGIPYTKRMAEILMGYSGAYTYYRSYVGAGEGLAGGRMLTLIESHYNTLKSGISFGSLSCKAIADARPYLAATTTSPDEAVFTKPGTDTRYLHARFAIEERDIRDISSVFITGVLDLMRYVEDNWELLVRDIEQGTIDASIQMPVDVRAGLEARIKPNPERAAELRAIFECGFDEPITPAMWPNLLVVRSVAGGGFAPYTQRLRRFIGNDVHILYTGYSASEGAFSVPFELDDPSSVLLPRSVYFGFVPVDDPDYDHTLGVEDLQEGHDYEVIITSRSGFYRYKMRDAIRCVGHKGTMPTMEFLFRLDQTVNMHGEKTTELVLRKVADKVAARAGLDLVDFSVHPNVDHHPARYEYLLEFYHADHAAIDLAELSRIAWHLVRRRRHVRPGHRARAAGRDQPAVARYARHARQGPEPDQAGAHRGHRAEAALLLRAHRRGNRRVGSHGGANREQRADQADVRQVSGHVHPHHPVGNARHDDRQRDRRQLAGVGRGGGYRHVAFRVHAVLGVRRHP